MKLIWFCAAGHSFMAGIVLLLAATYLSMACRRVWHRLLVYLATFIAAALIFMSATPLELWFYVVWIALVIGWLASLTSGRATKWLSFKLLIDVLVLWTVIAYLSERPYRIMPAIPAERFGMLYVIGDSISGGIGRADEQTWPLLLGSQHGVNVVNLAKSGATVTTALKQVAQIDSGDTLVLVEIGGNDFFAPTPYAEFRQNLGEVLRQAGGNGRVVVMMEVPLLPWQLEYGRIQRELAKEHKVILIPKRYFVQVLSVEGASTDLAHLSAKGHQLMADEMWSILGKCLESDRR